MDQCINGNRLGVDSVGISHSIEEGEAEFLAGSSRLNGVQTRKTMVANIAWNEADRMTLNEVVNAQYGNWSFYTYGFAFFDYMYKNRMDLYIDMISCASLDKC